jgi:hypothetical protein
MVYQYQPRPTAPTSRRAPTTAAMINRLRRRRARASDGSASSSPSLVSRAGSRCRSSGMTRSTRCSIRGRASRSAPPLAGRPRVSLPPRFSGTSADYPNTARHRSIIVGHGEEFGFLDRLSTLIGVHEPTSMVRPRRVWSVDDRQAVISCSSKRIAVEDSDLSGSGQPDHTAAFQLSESTAHRLY